MSTTALVIPHFYETKSMGGARALEISAKTVTALKDGLACKFVAASPNGRKLLLESTAVMTRHNVLGIIILLLYFILFHRKYEG